MNKKLPMMVLISSPRMRRGEAGDLEEMFDCGLERLHLRKPDHSAKDVSKILDKIPENTWAGSSCTAYPNCSRSIPLLVIIIRRRRSFATSLVHAAVLSTKSRTSAKTGKSWTTRSLARFTIRSQSKDMVPRYRSSPFVNILPRKIVRRFLLWEGFEETR